LNLKK